MGEGLRPASAATLVAAASEAAAQAYAPYSAFHVGAALLGESGAVYAACNVENASYGLSLCAERAAVCAAVAAGERRFRAVAVVGRRAGRDHSREHTSVVQERSNAGAVAAAECLPCGACRQVLAEFCGPQTTVFTVDAAGSIHRRRLGDLLPEVFRL